MKRNTLGDLTARTPEDLIDSLEPCIFIVCYYYADDAKTRFAQSNNFPIIIIRNSNCDLAKTNSTSRPHRRIRTISFRNTITLYTRVYIIFLKKKYTACARRHSLWRVVQFVNQRRSTIGWGRCRVTGYYNNQNNTIYVIIWVQRLEYAYIYNNVIINIRWRCTIIYYNISLGEKTAFW